jgi:hypothetical protein
MSPARLTDLPLRLPPATGTTRIATLSQAFDISHLGQLLVQQDRAGYYSYLAAQGSIYAPLALGVVRRDTPSGMTAVMYCQEFARRRAVRITDQDFLRINLALMERDYKARSELPGAGFRELPMAAIRAYHADVFRTLFNLPPEAWTAEVPLQCAGPIRADAVWLQMLTDGFIEVGIATVMSVIQTMPTGLRKYAIACFAQSLEPTLDRGQWARDEAYRYMTGEELYLGAIPAHTLQRLALPALQHHAVEYLDTLSCSGTLVTAAIARAAANRVFH